MSHATPLRIARSAGDWVSFQLHREALERFVPRGSRVLEVSAGAGHFTEALHHLGCKVTVLDESLDELESNRVRAHARGFASSIEGWAQRDICALGDLADASFDAVVAYGAALSHALERRDRALGECMRVLRPRGVLVLDALSLWGSMRRNFPQMLARDLVQNRAIIRSGNAPPSLFGIERAAIERGSSERAPRAATRDEPPHSEAHPHQQHPHQQHPHQQHPHQQHPHQQHLRQPPASDGSSHHLRSQEPPSHERPSHTRVAATAPASEASPASPPPSSPSAAILPLAPAPEPAAPLGAHRETGESEPMPPEPGQREPGQREPGQREPGQREPGLREPIVPGPAHLEAVARPPAALQPAELQSNPSAASLDASSPLQREASVGSQPSHPVPEPLPRERHSHLFRAAELEAFLRRAGLEVLSLSASSALSTGVEMPMASDPGTWSALLEYERAACVERGYLDSGQYLIAIARR